jgi:hypothetical protein
MTHAPVTLDDTPNLETRSIDEILSGVADALIEASAFTTAAGSIVQCYHLEGPAPARRSISEKMAALERVLGRTEAALEAAWRAIDCKVAEIEAT